MITFSQLGQLGKGRLGNQLFQIASTVGIAIKNNHSFFFPEWEYQDYFEYNFPTGKLDSDFVELEEKKFNYYEWEIGDGNYDLSGWLQSEFYFDADLTKNIFSFEPNFKQRVLQRDQKFFNRKTILISVRRGDFVHNPGYFQLSFKYYFLAIMRYFPDWEKRNLIFASDDILYCEKHFGHLDNAFFFKDRSAVEQLLLGSQCDDYVISNSTFSWWIAWLGEKDDSKVICPIKNFSTDSSDPNKHDFYPKRWVKFDHRNKSIPLRFFSLIVKGNLFALKSYTKYRIKKFINKYSE